MKLRSRRFNEVSVSKVTVSTTSSGVARGALGSADPGRHFSGGGFAD